MSNRSLSKRQTCEPPEKLSCGHMRWRSWFFAGVALLAGAEVQGQAYRLKDGRILSADAVVVRGNQLVQVVGKTGAGEGEVGFPISSVASLEWPEPVELAQAKGWLLAGEGEKARAAAQEIVRQFAPFAKIPGSWWCEGELLRVRALMTTDRENEVLTAVESLAAGAAVMDVRRAAQVLLAGMAVREKRYPRAETILSDVLKEAAAKPLEADALVVLGELHLARARWESALEAYLHIPVFHPQRRDLLPKAIWGSAHAYRGLGDVGRAERAMLELIDQFPESPEGKQARQEASR